MTVLSLFALLSSAQPWVAPPREPVTVVSEPLAFGPLADGDLASAEVGSEDVVVWSDDRWPSMLFGVRLRSDGSRVEQAATLVSSSAFLRSVAVASNGSTLLVCWTSFGKVQARRYSPALVPIDAAPVTITEESPTVRFYDSVAAAWDGQQWVVSYLETSSVGAAKLLLGRIASSGVVTTRSQLLDASAANRVRPRLAVASTGRIAVLYENHSAQVVLQRVDPDGSLLDSSPVVLTSTATVRRALALASSGAQFLATWSMSSGAQVARLGLTGAPIDSPPLPLSGAPADIDSLVAGWTTAGGFVSWGTVDGTSNAVRPLDLNLGQPGAATGLPVGTLRSAHSRGQGALLLYAQTAASSAAQWNKSVFTVRLSGTLQPIDPQPVHQVSGAAQQSYPAIGSNGTLSLVAWTERTVVDSAKLVVARVDASGTSLDGPGVVLSTSALVGGARARVTWDGVQFIVAWQEQARTVHAARVSAQGSVLGPVGGATVLPSTPTQKLFTASVDGVTLVCEDQGRCARFRADGTVADPVPFNVSAQWPLGALAVVGDQVMAGFFNGQLSLRTVELPTATLGAPVSLAVASQAQGLELTPFSTGAFVSWQEGATSRFSTYSLATNSLAAPLTTPIFLGQPYTQLVSAGGSVLRVARTVNTMTQRFGLTMQRLGADAQPIDLAPLDVSAALPTDYNLSSAAFEVTPLERGWAIATTAFIARDGTMNERVLVSRLSFGAPDGAGCGSADVCGSGVCTAGVCCATTCSGTCGGGVCQSGTGGGGGSGSGGGAGTGGGSGTGGGAGTGGGTGASLTIVSEPPSTGSCGEPWLYEVQANDGAQVSWSSDLAQATLTPTGATSASFAWTPDASATGVQVVEITASRDGVEVIQRFSVTVSCPPLTPVGCSCAAFDAPGALVLGLLALMRRRRAGAAR